MFTIKTTISKKRIQNLLVGALEGGSNYWYSINRYVFPDGITHQDFREGGKFTDPHDYFHSSEIIPLTEGCSVIIDAEDYLAPDGKEWTLNLESIQRGLNIFEEKSPYEYGRFITEDDDAGTSDVFLQLCLFGEIVFG